MLSNFFWKFKFLRFCQSGWYVDFFLKKFSEVFLRNIFIYLAQFFAEKYMIEVLTKKIITFSVIFFNKYLGWNNLIYFNFFIQFLTIVFYLIFILNFFLFF